MPTHEVKWSDPMCVARSEYKFEQSDLSLDLPIVEYDLDVSGELWWCNSHQRRATHLIDGDRRVCDPDLGGILLPCRCVNLTGIAELDE